MPGKQRGDNSAAPRRVRHFEEQPEQQQSVTDVEHETGQMMARRVCAEDLAIEHVRNPGERMPIAAVDLREGPGD